MKNQIVYLTNSSNNGSGDEIQYNFCNKKLLVGIWNRTKFRLWSCAFFSLR